MRFVRTILITAVIFLFSGGIACAQVVINEIAWMGSNNGGTSSANSADEWIELYNGGLSAVAISDWHLFINGVSIGASGAAASTMPPLTGSIPAGGFYLLERTDDNSVPGITADYIYTGALANTNVTLTLKNGSGAVVDEVASGDSWSLVGGDNDTKHTAQRSGTGWTTAAPTPRASNPGQSPGASNDQSQTVTSVATSTDTGSGGTPSGTVTGSSVDSSGASSDSAFGKTSWPVDPQTFSRIIGPAIAVAGADVLFQGESVDIDKKPLANARYLWNFGDGATKEGQSVMHGYNFPADYVVILDVSGGKSVATSRFKIKVIPADIIIGNVVAGPDGKIEIVNRTGQELNLSWWRLRSGGQFFTLPKNTILLPKATLPFAAAVTGLSADQNNVALLYPNGSVAYTFEPAATASAVAAAPTPTEDAVEKLPEVPPAKVSEEVTANPVVKNQSGIQKQTQAAAVAFSAENESADEPLSDSNVPSHSSLWLYGVGGVIILGLGFALAPKPVVPAKNLAEEFTIIE